MDAAQSIAALGAHAGADLLNTVGFDEDDDLVAGLEFTYLGIYISALAYGKVNDPNLDIGEACMAAVRSVTNKADGVDANMLNMLAYASLTAYEERLPEWPKKEDRSIVSFELCDLLVRLLKNSAPDVEITVNQKALLRPKIADAFEVLEVAHTEIRNELRLPHSAQPRKVAVSSASKSTPLEQIETAKSELLDDFDNGHITTAEYGRGLNALWQQELSLHLEQLKQTQAPAASPLLGKKVRIFVCAAFVLGFFISPWLYPKIFGYSSAEECTLNAKHRYAVDACHALYPSIDDKR